MRIIQILLLAFITPLACNASAAAQAKPSKNIVDVQTGDSDMEAAKQKARATLAEFFKLAKAPSPSMTNFTLKVGVPVDGTFEFVWVRPFEKKRNRYSGQIRVDMVGRPFKFGDTINFTEADIADWYYLDSGKMKGNFTACALFKNKPRSEFAMFQKQYGIECEF